MASEKTGRLLTGVLGTLVIFFASLAPANAQMAPGFATLGGIVSAGLQDGATVTVVFSSGSFDGDGLHMATCTVAGGACPYTVILPAPAMYRVGAVGGVFGDDSGPPPGSPIGFYGNFQPVALESEQLLSGINFAIVTDTIAPVAVITSPEGGATLLSLGSIAGLLSDNVGVDSLSLAVVDLNNGRWWDASQRSWISSSQPLYGKLEVNYNNSPSSGGWTADFAAFGGLSSEFLHGHTYSLYVRAKDFSENMQAVVSAVNFTFVTHGTATVGGFVSAEVDAGSALTVVASTDYFRGDGILSSTVMAATGGAAYVLTLQAPATYYIGAVSGLISDHGPAPEALLGFYGGFSPVYLSVNDAKHGIDFNIIRDELPPSAAVTSIESGSGQAMLSAVSGTAADNVGVSYLSLAAYDITDEKWWNPDQNLWLSSATPYVKEIKAVFNGPPPQNTWATDLADTFGGFANRLHAGHHYNLMLTAFDLSGNSQTPVYSTTFTWTGAEGWFGPESVRALAGIPLGVSSISWTWATAQAADGYHIYSETGELISDTPETQYVSTGLQLHSRQRLCVIAYNSFGTGGQNCAEAHTFAYAPGTPVISDLQADGFTATWSRNGNPEEVLYELQVSSNDFLTLAFSAIVYGYESEPVYSVYNLSGDTAYSVRVKVHNWWDGPSVFSVPVTVRTLMPPPPPPVEISALVQEVGRIWLSWTIPSGVAPAFYNIYRSTDPQALIQGAHAPHEALMSSGNVSTSYVDAPGASGVYYYGVTAYAAAGGEGALSEIVPVALDMGTPSAEVVFASTRPALGLGAHPFRLLISEPLAYPPVLTITPAGQSPTLLRLMPESPVVWVGTVTVGAQTATGEAAFAFSGEDLAGNAGNWLKNGGVVMLDSHGPSAYVQGPSITGPGDLRLSLLIDEPVLGIPELRVIPAGKPALSVTVSPASQDGRTWEAVLAISPATGDGKAVYQYSATDLAGNTGTLINGTTSFLIDTLAPGVPGLLAATPSAGGTIRLQWSAPAGAMPDSYLIYRDELRLEPVISTSSAGGWYLDSPGDGQHAYAVSALDTAGNESLRSNTATASADAVPPETPENLLTSVNDQGAVSLTWSAATDAVKYRIYRSTVAGSRPAEALTIDSSGTSATDRPAADGIYYYSVTALDAAGNESQASPESHVLFDKAAPVITITGVNANAAYPDAVYPAWTIVDSNLAEGMVRATLNSLPFLAGSAVTGEGSYVLSVYAEDTDVNGSTRSVIFFIDKTSPVITVTGLSNGGAYNSAVSAVIQCADLRLATSTYLLDSAAYVSGTPISADGLHTLSLTATDKAGNTTTQQLVFSVNAPPPAPKNFKLEANAAGGAALNWERPDTDVIGYRVYRDGLRISASLQPQPSFYDAAYPGGQGRAYAVSAVDSLGQEGARAEINIPAVDISLAGYGSVVGGAEALNRGFFDTVRLSLGNNSMSTLAGVQVYLELAVPGGVQRSTIAAAAVQAGGAAQVSGVVAVPPALTTPAALKVIAALGTGLTCVKNFQLIVRQPAEPVLELTHQPFVLGADAGVSLKFNNRGSAPLDIETARIRDGAPITGGMVALELQSSGGVLLARTGLTQTGGGVSAALTDTTAAGDGPVEKELTYYVTVPGGSSFMFAPVAMPIPDAAYGTLLLSARVARPVHDMAGSALSGQGIFQTLVNEPTVSAAPYNVTVAVGQAVYDQDQPITISGQASTAGGALLPGASVQVELTGRGYTRNFQAVTDAEGAYSLVFSPMPGEAGQYSLAASPPDAVNHAVQSVFAITGFRFAQSAYSGTISQNGTLDISVDLSNTGETPLSGLSGFITATEANGVSLYLAGAGMPSTLEAGTRTTLKLKATAAANAPASSNNFTLTVTDVNGFNRTLPITLSVMEARPIPAATPASFETGLLAGAQKYQTITLTNKGFNTWQNVTVNLPPALDWLHLQSPASMGDIPPGGTAMISLLIAPQDMQVTDIYSAPITVTATNTDALTIPGKIAITAAQTGTVNFTVVNGDVPVGHENEFIAGAKVSLNNLDVPTNSYAETSNAQGQVPFAAIPAGRYSYKVEAGGFQAIKGGLNVEPGLAGDIEAVLVTNMVTYDWSVTPTTILDSYEIKLDLTYNASVDAPVVIADPPFIQINEPAGKTVYTQYTLTNKGKVSAFDVKLTPTEGSGIKLEVPFASIPELKPNQSVVVPLKIYVVHTSCEKAAIETVFTSTCPRTGEGVDRAGGALQVANGGSNKECSALENAMSITSSAGESAPCVYAPVIVGDSDLGTSTKTYVFTPKPEDSPCPLCNISCDNLVWTGSNLAIAVSTESRCIAYVKMTQPGGGTTLMATVGDYQATKKINPCKIQSLVIKPNVPKYEQTTSVVGPALGFYVEVDTPSKGCPMDLEWSLIGAGEISQTGIFSPKMVSGSPTISVKDKISDKTARTYATVVPLVFTISDVHTPSEDVEPKGEDSFIAEDKIIATAKITPLAAHEMYINRVQWTVPKARQLGTSDVTGAGEELIFAPSPPVAAGGRDQIPLKYYILANLVIQDIPFTTMQMIRQDRRDVLRQEYTPYDIFVNRVPRRSEVLDQSTEGFKYIDPGDFTFADIEDGDYPDFAVFSIAQTLQNIRSVYKKAMPVSSGYRNPVHNESLKPDSATNSLHIYGLAADIDIDNADDTAWIALCKEAVKRGACIEPHKLASNRVHMDWRAIGECAPNWPQQTEDTCDIENW